MKWRSVGQCGGAGDRTGRRRTGLRAGFSGRLSGQLPGSVGRCASGFSRDLLMTSASRAAAKTLIRPRGVLL
jgi:hypothetical protein